MNVAAEVERVPCRLLMQRLQTIARLLVLVHAGQPIPKQRPFHIMLRCRARTCQVHRRQRIINATIQTQRTSRHRHSLRFHLRLVAHRLVRRN